MFSPSTHRRLPYILTAGSLFFLFAVLYNSNFRKATWRQHIQNIGLGEWGTSWQDDISFHLMPNFTRGFPKPPGSNYTRTLVVARTKSEDISWMDEHIPDIHKMIYVADDPHAPLHPPQNKGHELMIYLTYLIDYYDDLPDIVMFMHAHQLAWHNADILGSDAAQMITRLSAERVIREGYMNMRCNWEPGCPNWMHPGETEYDEYKSEEILIAKAWTELFPLDPIPDVLAQTCCSQFAVSRERIQTIPRAKFIYYRNWLVKTPLKDFVSGRVWEYMWQYVFTGQSYLCPIEHICYCDGFGVCFGGKEQFDAYYELRGKRDQYDRDLNEWEELGKKVEEAIEEGRFEDAEEMGKPEEGLDVLYKQKIEEYEDELSARVAAAIERGNDPRNRAAEAGREWKEGDGY